MEKTILNMAKPQEVWVWYVDEMDTTEGKAKVYFLISASSTVCFDHIICAECPSQEEITHSLKNAYAQRKRWPKYIAIAKEDAFASTVKMVCERLQVQVSAVPFHELRAMIKSFSEQFDQFKNEHEHEQITQMLENENENEHMKALVPDPYHPCSCASGKKFKFCCQKVFKYLIFAMCAAEEGNLEEALQFMKKAESKVGRTAEILCRYAICWSYFDKEKYHDYLTEAKKLNPNHPRLNYICGVEASAKGEFEEAISYYEKAIENYPKEDRYHLNETYNNLGIAYFERSEYKNAKDTWEKGLIILPSDQMVKKNLIKFIYQNPELPVELRTISPFVSQHLTGVEVE